MLRSSRGPARRAARADGLRSRRQRRDITPVIPPRSLFASHWNEHAHTHALACRLGLGRIRRVSEAAAAKYRLIEFCKVRMNKSDPRCDLKRPFEAGKLRPNRHMRFSPDIPMLVGHDPSLSQEIRILSGVHCIPINGVM